MSKRTCSLPDCDKPFRARGLCAAHYNRAYCPERHGDPAEDAARRRAARERDRLDPAKVAKERERSARRNAELKAKRAEVREIAAVTNDLPDAIDAEMDAVMRWRYIDCGWCGEQFWTKRHDAIVCSMPCKRAAKNMRRRAREYAAPGTYTWSEVASVYRDIGRVCAYCHEYFPLADIEPDHVVALSVGGSNSIHNIVPSCQKCNGDKRELSMSEWAADRRRRGLPLRSLHPKISHLTSLALTA
ncbi:HNH endonuclease [Demequina globuliformis]|uniref:HNH endonuclease n=1 Tax=Demequina globuliformis TaxID=676202 RepID=UPI000AA20F22|nr:HNH endonuclease [Demequina globuliformis]